MLCLSYCSFNFIYSLFYKPTMTTTKLPLVGWLKFFELNWIEQPEVFMKRLLLIMWTLWSVKCADNTAASRRYSFHLVGLFIFVYSKEPQSQNPPLSDLQKSKMPSVHLDQNSHSYLQPSEHFLNGNSVCNWKLPHFVDKRLACTHNKVVTPQCTYHGA